MRCPCCGAPRRSVQNQCAICGAPVFQGIVMVEHSPEPAAATPAPYDALVLHDGTPLRDRARGPAAVLQTLGTGDLVHVLGRSGKYMHVRALTGVSGYVDSVQLGPVGAVPAAELVAVSEAAPAPEAPPSAIIDGDRADLPFGVVGLPGESIAYMGKFIYDPFNDRAFVVTSHRVIIGGGGAPMPRVAALIEIESARMRDGSNGMALGERTIVLQVTHLPGETYIAGLRDPERALASLIACMREAGATASEPAP